MGFATGFKTGYEAVSDTIREYERQKLKEGLRKLGPEATAVSGQGFEVIGPEGRSEGLITPQPGVDLEAIKQAYASGGYTFRPTEGPAFAARAGGKDIGMYVSEESARGAAEPYNIGLTRQAAGLYEQAGLDAEARQMRGQARQAESDLTRLGMEKTKLGYEAEKLGLAKEESARADKLAEARLISEGLTQEQAQLQIAREKRVANEQANMEKFTTYMQDNPNATRADLKAAAKNFGLTVDQQFNVVSRMTGMAEDDLKAFQADVKNTIKGKNLGELLNIHKNDSRFDDKTYFKQRKGPKGEVILDLIDQATGKTISSESFKDANLATAYLSKAALEPDQLAEWMLNIRGAEGKISLQKSQERENEARAAYLGRGGAGGGGRDKTPFAVKSQIDNAERTLELTNKALAEQPNNKDLQQRATMQKFELANLYRSQGIEIDPYKFAGVPPPKSAISSSDIKTLSEAELGARIEAARRMFGDQYADEFSSFVQANRPAAKVEKGGLEKPSAKTEAAAPSKKSSTERAKEIEAQLAVDTKIKEGGLFGIGGRAISERAVPLGIGARRDLERELEKLRSEK